VPGAHLASAPCRSSGVGGQGRCLHPSQYIYNFNSSAKTLLSVYGLLDTLNQQSNGTWVIGGSRVGFGLGAVQWTFGRTLKLVEEYIGHGTRDESGYVAVNYDQVMAAEMAMIYYELSNTKDYRAIYPKWEKDNRSRLASSAAANSAGVSLCNDYERPKYRAGDEKTWAKKWGGDAAQIYKIMMSGIKAK